MRELILYWHVIRSRWRRIMALMAGAALVAGAWGWLPRPESWTAAATIWLQPEHQVVLRARMESQQLARALHFRDRETVTVQDRQGIAVVMVRSPDPARPVPLANLLVDHVQRTFEAERAAYHAQVVAYRGRQVERLQRQIQAVASEDDASTNSAAQTGVSPISGGDQPWWIAECTRKPCPWWSAGAPVIIVGAPTDPKVVAGAARVDAVAQRAERRRTLEQQLEEFRLGPAPTREVPAVVLIDPAWRAVALPRSSPWKRVSSAAAAAALLGVGWALVGEWWARERAKLQREQAL